LEWAIVIDAPLARSVEKATGFQIFKLYVPAEQERLADDPMLLIDVITAVCGEQIEQREMTESEFQRRLSGDPIEAALLATLRAVADFMPPKKKRLILEFLDSVIADQDQEFAAAEENLQRVMKLNQMKRQAKTKELQEQIAELQRTILPEPSGT